MSYTDEALEFNPDPNVGLSASQVKTQIDKGLSNEVTTVPYKTTSQIIKDNVFTFFNLVFFILFLCLLFVGSYKDMLFMLVVVINTFIGIVQQIRSKKVIEKMTILVAPRCRVVRDGKVKNINSCDLVKEDIVVFKAGNQILADCVVKEGEVQVDEQLLTGETDPVFKSKGHKLYSGSVILAGNCKAIVMRVGEDSYANKMTIAAKACGGYHKSEMMASLDNLIKVIGIVLIPIGLLMLLKHIFILHISYEQSMVSTVAALVGMIPEGLYLLTSVALALSVIKLSKKNTLVNEMNCIETLARTDVLCLDKTGTITEPNIKVEGVKLLNIEYDKKRVEDILGGIYKNIEPENQTAQAIKDNFTGNLNLKIKKRRHFMSSTKWEAYETEAGPIYLIGSPENILQSNFFEIEDLVNNQTKKGKRVLLFAKLNGEIKGDSLNGKVIPIAFIIMSNRVRQNAEKTFDFFKQQGVRIIVISGDDENTASFAAKEAGLDGYNKTVNAKTLTDDDKISQAVLKYNIFGRVTPLQKKKIIEALKKKNHSVAMTGDGVNDILALREADISIAMASGSEAATQASDLVLLDSDFSSMPSIVNEGRRVINNIERAASLFLVKNIFSFLLALISLAVKIPYPFSPLQLTLVSAVTIGIPAFFLALEPNNSIVKGSFIKNVLSQALPGGLTDLIILLGAQIVVYVYGLNTYELSTMSTILLGVVGFVVLYNVSKPFEIKRFIIWISMVAVFVISITLFGSFFSLCALSVKGLITLIILAVLIYPVFQSMSFICKRLIELFSKRKS